MAIDIQKSLRVGFGVGITAWLISFVYNMFATVGGIQASLNLAPITDSVKQQIQAGINTDLASRIIGWLNGVLPISLMGLITLAVAGALIVLAGTWLINVIPVKQLREGKSLRRLVTITVIGSLGLGLLVSFFAGNPSLPAFSAAISMVIYFTIVAFVYGVIANLSKGNQLRNIFMEL